MNEVITCDYCKDTFRVISFGLIDFKNMKLRFFVCPTCGKMYVIFVETQRTKLLQEELKQIDSKIFNDECSEEEVKELIKLRTKKSKILLKLQNNLKDKYNMNDMFIRKKGVYILKEKEKENKNNV